MIETSDLQAFVEKIQGGTIPVDLLKIGQAHYSQYGGNAASKNKYSSNNHHGKFRIALDIEDCLDRFYGGYYSDWACGGQWNRAYQFVQLLVNAFNTAHIDVIAFFDGTLKENKKHTFERNEFRQKTISVLKHIRMIGTPPPKIWWLPPSGLRTCLRNALRSLNIVVVQTVCDHTMEIIDYFHEYKLDGILGLNPDYIIANTSKYYSSHDLRLSYKGALETKEYLVSKLLSNLSLTPDHLPFMAVFLGGYILIDEPTLKNIYQKINVDYATDFEARIRKIAEIVRNSPTNEIDEFVRHLSLEEWAKDIKESVEYFQRKARFLNNKKFFGNKRKTIVEIQRIDDNVPTVPLASETNDTDELARKILHDVNNLVDDSEPAVHATNVDGQTADSALGVDPNRSTDNKVSSGGALKKLPAFVYALPGEVLKTSLNRHQRGIMDSRIYQLLTKKEIILPQILEDEQYREIPSIHLFYRPARQFIYAILYNLYHQKYLCSKALAAQNKEKNQSNRQNIIPEVQVSEWIWSPQNEYKKPELVNAVQLPWAVPTIQRLWFGMAFEDKQRRMKAFLTVMRSDTPLMLNRGYVPQHMLVMACVLRYIVTSPDRNILTRQELDAFLATAFSPHIVNVDYTQELVLPGVHLRGIYLATLFMQGVETASLANDACGVPLPWMMTNPWLFFDGKLFHLKLKMSSYVQTLRDLCDNHIDVVLKIERFRKAILEDVEHYLLPPHMDSLYRAGFIQSSVLPQGYGKNAIHTIANIPNLSNSSSSSYYNAVAQPQQTIQIHQSQQSQQASQSYYNSLTANRNNANYRNRYGNNSRQQQQQQQQPSHQPHHLITRQAINRQGGYQLKVGGVVVGSWAGGAPNRGNTGGVQARLNRAAIAAAAASGTNAAHYIRYPLNARTRASVNARIQRNIGHAHQHVTSLSRTISRNTYGIKVNRNRNRRNRNKERKGSTSDKEAGTATNKTDKESDEEDTESDENKTEDAVTQETENSNGRTTIQASSLAKSMCHDILKEEDDDLPVANSEKQKVSDEILDEQNGNVSTKLSNLSINDNHDDKTTVNGNTIDVSNTKINGDDDIIAKKTGKKGNNNNNNNDNNKIGTEHDSNDQSADIKNDNDDIEKTTKISTHSDELINDENNVTVKG